METHNPNENPNPIPPVTDNHIHKGLLALAIFAVVFVVGLFIWPFLPKSAKQPQNSNPNINQTNMENNTSVKDSTYNNVLTQPRILLLVDSKYKYVDVNINNYPPIKIVAGDNKDIKLNEFLASNNQIKITTGPVSERWQPKPGDTTLQLRIVADNRNIGFKQDDTGSSLNF